MSKEESKKIYTNINVDNINDKMAEAMMELMKGNVTCGADLYHIVRTTLTPEECVYLVTIMIAERTHKSIKENPMIMLLASMARHQQQEENKIKDKGQEEILKTVFDILNGKDEKK